MNFCVYFLNLVQYDIKNCKKNHKNLRMSEKSCIFAAIFSAIRYYLCVILPAKSCKICAKTTAKSRWKNVIERNKREIKKENCIKQ